jgi:hypothetical protein
VKQARLLLQQRPRTSNTALHQVNHQSQNILQGRKGSGVPKSQEIKVDCKEGVSQQAEICLTARLLFKKILTERTHCLIHVTTMTQIHSEAVVLVMQAPDSMQIKILELQGTRVLAPKEAFKQAEACQ